MCGGEPAQDMRPLTDTVLFPACAGVNLSEAEKNETLGTFPRMCGGEPDIINADGSGACFSPHVRG